MHHASRAIRKTHWRSCLEFLALLSTTDVAPLEKGLRRSRFSANQLNSSLSFLFLLCWRGKRSCCLSLRLDLFSYTLEPFHCQTCPERNVTATWQNLDGPLLRGQLRTPQINNPLILHHWLRSLPRIYTCSGSSPSFLVFFVGYTLVQSGLASLYIDKVSGSLRYFF